jgi:hypothetical protein
VLKKPSVVDEMVLCKFSFFAATFFFVVDAIFKLKKFLKKTYSMIITSEQVVFYSTAT